MPMLKRFASAARFGFVTFLLGRVRPYLFGMVITDRCNLDCFYCEGRNKGLIQFTFEGACEALEQAYRRGHRTLYFTGGEPLIWHDGDKRLRHVVGHALELGFFNIFVFTNGTKPLDIPGCSYIVTIDGPRDIHNAVRSGTYDAVIENVRHASTRNVFASMCSRRENTLTARSQRDKAFYARIPRVVWNPHRPQITPSVFQLHVLLHQLGEHFVLARQ